MPEMKAYFSRGMSREARTFWTTARTAKSPQPGHQRTIWSEANCFESCSGPEPGSSLIHVLHISSSAPRAGP